MFRSFLSWRYMFARRTNLIGMVGIFVAVGALILILSIMTGFLEESRKTVRGSLADILIEPYFERAVVGARPIPRDPQPLLDAVREDPRVQGATPQLVWGGIITQSGRNFERHLSNPTNPGLLAVQLIGVDVRTAERIALPMAYAAASAVGAVLPRPSVQDEFDATDFFSSLVRSRNDNRRDYGYGAPVDFPLLPFARNDYEPTGRPKRGAIIGEQLFSSLSMRRGDVIQIATAVPDPNGGDWAINNREFVVVGTFRSGENEADLQRIYFERGELRDFLGGRNQFSQVLLRLNDYEKEGQETCLALRDDLTERGVIQGGSVYARYEVRTWEQFRQNLMGAIENERALMGIMLSLVLVVAGFTIFAILSMMVTEKRRDIGILGALGATPTGVMQMFLMIAFWDALLGATLGAIFGTWAAIRIDALERWLSDVFNVQIFNRDVYLFDHIPSIVQPVSVAAIVLGAFFCALLFAFIPAWRASRLDPLEALRYE